jgi:hypothetical protein
MMVMATLLFLLLTNHILTSLLYMYRLMLMYVYCCQLVGLFFEDFLNEIDNHPTLRVIRYVWWQWQPSCSFDWPTIYSLAFSLRIESYWCTFTGAYKSPDSFLKTSWMELTIIQHFELLGKYDGDGDPSVPLIDQPCTHSPSLYL